MMALLMITTFIFLTLAIAVSFKNKELEAKVYDYEQKIYELLQELNEKDE